MLTLIAFFTFSACEDKEDPAPNPEEGNEKNQTINKWIYDWLDESYLWNDKIPDIKSLDLNSEPTDFFYSSLYKYRQTGGDYFSRIESTHAGIPKSVSLEDMTASSSDIGFEYMHIQYVNNSGTPTGEYAYLVIYVKKGTDAEKQKLKRGHLITAVDGKKITNSNVSDLLTSGASKYSFTINDYEQQKQITINLNPTYNYEENPIFLDSIYTIGNKKIGYIVYNSFEAGGEDLLPYDVQLSKVFARFKEKGVSDLILDLRYNGGGLVRSAQFIASAIVPARDTKNIFEVKTYNPSTQQILDRLPNDNTTKISYMYEYFVNNIETSKGKSLAEIPRLGDQLNSFYVLGTKATASASEMVINTLKPYFDESKKTLRLIGEKTTGKNVGSWPIYEKDNKDNTYVMWPITFQSHNKLYLKYPDNPEITSNYAQGFTPYKTIDELAEFFNGGVLKGFGDIEESLLSVTIEEITGKKTKTISSPESVNRGFKVGRSSLEKRRNANQLVVEESKSSLLREGLKSLSVEQ